MIRNIYKSVLFSTCSQLSIWIHLPTMKTQMRFRPSSMKFESITRVQCILKNQKKHLNQAYVLTPNENPFSTAITYFVEETHLDWGHFQQKNGDWKSKLSSAWRNTFSRGHKKREWRRLLVMYIFSHICTSFNLFHSYLEYISVICVWIAEFYWKRELHDWVFALRLVNDARLPPKWRVLLWKMGIRGETCPTEKAMVLTDVNVIWWTCALHWWSTTFPDCAAHTDTDEDLSTERTTAFTQGCE